MIKIQKKIFSVFVLILLFSSLSVYSQNKFPEGSAQGRTEMTGNVRMPDVPNVNISITEPKTGEDPTQQKPQAQQPTVNPHASLIEKINSTNDVASLVSIYLDNTQVIESNSELKSLLTNRKKALQTLNAA